MQPAIPNTCEPQDDVNLDRPAAAEMTPRQSGAIRVWIMDMVAWLDRHWDDPELRSGFWRSGW
jgi:hypothetical protein